MILSKRERYIAIGAGGALGLMVLNMYFLTPYIERQRQISQATDKVKEQLDRSNTLLRQERDLKPVWKEIVTGGLKAVPPDAESQAENAVQDWIRDLGVSLTLTDLKPDRPTADGKFEIVGLHVTATGRMAAINKFIWSLELSPVPLRVTDVQVTPQKEGTDQLQVQVTVSTLSTLEVEPSAAQPATRANTGGRP